VVNIYLIDPMKVFRDKPKSEVDKPCKNMQNHVFMDKDVYVCFLFDNIVLFE
jgi:hypothetical protein